MSSVADKLNAEIRTFTMIQFLGAMVGMISALYFSFETKHEVAAAAAVLAMAVVGQCDFFIHRSGEYIRLHAPVDPGTANYEIRKAEHSTTKYVVPGVMAIFALTLVFILLRSFFSMINPLGSVAGVILFMVFVPYSLVIFCLGAKLGKAGWPKSNE